MEIILGVIGIVIGFYLYLSWNFNFWKNRGVTGPKPYLFVGTFPKTFLDSTTNYLQETTEIYRFVNLLLLLRRPFVGFFFLLFM